MTDKTQQTDQTGPADRARQLRSAMQAEGVPLDRIIAALATEGINLFACAWGRQEAAAWLRSVAARLEAENDPLGTKH
jgi:hypothetical protein